MVKNGPTPASKRKVVKKKTNSFLRFQADQFLRLSHRDKVSSGAFGRTRRAPAGPVRAAGPAAERNRATARPPPRALSF
jgi:hypothetical protein